MFSMCRKKSQATESAWLGESIWFFDRFRFLCEDFFLLFFFLGNQEILDDLEISMNFFALRQNQVSQRRVHQLVFQNRLVVVQQSIPFEIFAKSQQRHLAPLALKGTKIGLQIFFNKKARDFPLILDDRPPQFLPKNPAVLRHPVKKVAQHFIFSAQLFAGQFVRRNPLVIDINQVVQQTVLLFTDGVKFPDFKIIHDEALKSMIEN